MLHPSLEPSLRLLPADRPVALLTRHSLRESTRDPNGVPGYDLPLTPEGVTLAEAWGARMERPITAFHSSPVGRCVDTARAMARGAGQGDTAEVLTTPLLVEPGCFVRNIRKVGPLFLQMGPLAFANHHLQESVDGLLSPREGCLRLLEHVRTHVAGPGEMALHVTHDTILAAFMAGLLNRREIREEDWPWMMEGVWLWFDDNDRVHWIWRGEPGSRPRDLPENF